MTCEVAVMNTHGIALAADSAVTLDGSEKVYNSAEKLFQLAPSAPVGIMTYGAAELMGVPWETVIAGYSRKLGDRRFDTLGEYLKDLIEFIEGARPMFPASVRSVGQFLGRLIGVEDPLARPTAKGRTSAFGLSGARGRSAPGADRSKILPPDANRAREGFPCLALGRDRFAEGLLLIGRVSGVQNGWLGSERPPIRSYRD